MNDAKKTLDEFGIRLESYAPGRHYAKCPQCSAKRKGAHQKSECLGVTIDREGVRFGCNHCDFRGGQRFTAAARHRASRAEFSAIYDYSDESGALLFQVCRTADKQ